MYIKYPKVWKFEDNEFFLNIKDFQVAKLEFMQYHAISCYIPWQYPYKMKTKLQNFKNQSINPENPGYMFTNQYINLPIYWCENEEKISANEYIIMKIRKRK